GGFRTARQSPRGGRLPLHRGWGPAFLPRSLEAQPTLAEPLAQALHDADPARAHLVETALAQQPIDTPSIWPRLATVSAWADGASRGYAQRLQEMLPHAPLQPKGLMATEGALTLPRRGSPYPAPALTSAFLEFVDDAGQAFACDELTEGTSYRVVMTTPGGLYRYDLGDRVACRGHVGGVPRLEFTGRAVATDIV